MRGLPYSFLLASALLTTSGLRARETRAAHENAVGRTATLAEALIDARQGYDLARALELREKSRTIEEGLSSSAKARLRADVGLLVAELYRIDFEQTPPDQREERRRLGALIDDAALEGLALLDSVAIDSDSQRLRADLVGTLIRSKFRGKKYRRQMEEAAQRAVELDGRNALGWVSRAKPLLFAPGRSRQDLHSGLEYLQQALEIDPRLETAKLLRGRALAELDRHIEAIEELRAVLAANPACAPARDLLQEIQE